MLRRARLSGGRFARDGTGRAGNAGAAYLSGAHTRYAADCGRRDWRILRRMTPALNFTHQFVSGTSARTLLLLHGTGGDEHQLLALGRELDPAAALLSPRGPVSENGHRRFFRRLAEG